MVPVLVTASPGITPLVSVAWYCTTMVVACSSVAQPRATVLPALLLTSNAGPLITWMLARFKASPAGSGSVNTRSWASALDAAV